MELQGKANFTINRDGKTFNSNNEGLLIIDEEYKNIAIAYGFKEKEKQYPIIENKGKSKVKK